MKSGKVWDLEEYIKRCMTDKQRYQRALWHSVCQQMNARGTTYWIWHEAEQSTGMQKEICTLNARV